MKAIELIQIVSICIIVALIYLLIKARKHKEADDRIYETDLTGPITEAILQEYGFKVYDTKDKLYALHPDGISMTKTEDGWSIEIKGAKGGWHYNVSTIIGLFAFCGEHGKPIKKQG
jgi:hypothetical protein